MDFYYMQDGSRRGPVNAAQLKALARQGIITPETQILTGDGRQSHARKIKGLEFAPAAVPPPIPDPEPETDLYPVAAPPLEEPKNAEPAPAPAPEPVTVITPGGAYVDTYAPDPEPADKEDAKKRKARNSLDWWVTSLTAIAGLEIILGIIGGVFCIVRGVDDGADALIGTGVGAIIGGFASAILPLALASIGRFLLTHHD